MVIRSSFGANGFQSSFETVSLRGLGRLSKFDVCTASQKTDSINKIDIIKFANIGNDVATFAATKAMPGLRNRINLARRRFLLMERATTPKVLPPLTHYRTFSKKLDQIVSFTNLTYVFVGKNDAPSLNRLVKNIEQARTCSMQKGKSAS